MIFGFNTDIAVEGTVYHVQTELREHSALLESQIFVKGRCVGRQGSQAPAGIGEEQLHELARRQHREVVEAIRGGRLLGLALTKEALPKEDLPEEALPEKALPQEEAVSKEPSAKLTVEFMASQRLSPTELLLRFRVLSGGSAASGAELSANWKTVLSPAASSASEAGGQCAASTGTDGIAELRVAVGDSSAELELRARLEGQETTRRFLLKPSR